jgi:hypothetical protein
MTSYLSRFLSNAKDAVFHPITTTLQHTTRASCQIVAKTKEISRKVLTEKITVWGYDVNLAAKGTSIASSLLEKAHIKSVGQSEIPDSELRALMGRVRQEIDEKFQIISDSIINSADEKQTQVTEKDPTIELPEILELKEIESQSKNLLIKHILNFSSITWFDQKIFGGIREDSIEFYRQLVSQNTLDPLDAYYQILWEKSPFYYCLASIFIPIANWFIGLFINPSKGIRGGITNAKEVLSNYLKDPEKKRNEISELFKVSKDYFYKLFALYQSFAAVKKDPLNPDHSLTLNEYLDKKLKEDITTRDRDPKELSKRFNTTLVNLLSPKSDIWLIGSLIDPILKTILSFAINSIDPINKLLSSSFASTHSSLTFNYKVAALVESQVRQLNQDLIDSQKNQTLLSSKEELRIRPASSQDIISEEEKVLIEDFVSNLLKFLPLEGLQENQIEDLLKPKEKPSTFDFIKKPKEKINDLAENTIEKTLQSFGVDLFGMLTSNSMDSAKKIKIWTDVLNLGVGFFSEPGVARTNTDLIAIRQQARRAFKDLLNTALDFHFKNSTMKQSLDTNKLKTECIIKGIENNSTQFKEKVNLLQEQLRYAIETRDSKLLHRLNTDLLIEIKDFFTNSQLTTEEALSFPNIDQDAKKELKIASRRITLEVEKLLSIHDTIEDIIHRFSIDLPLHESALSLLSNSEVSENSTSTILPRKTSKFLSDQLGFIYSKQSEFSHDDYKINSEVIANAYIKIHEISELNRKIETNEQLASLLSKSQRLISENLTLKQAISNRPKQDEISQLKEKIKDLHLFILDIAGIFEVDIEYLSDIASCFLDLKEHLNAYDVDAESLEQLDNFLLNPNQSDIKENLRHISVAIKNLETKLLGCPKKDAHAATTLTKNNKKLCELQINLASLDIRCSLQSSISSIDDDEANLTSINALIEENTISLQLLLDQKIWHQNQLTALFDEINGQKQEQIDKTWDEVSDLKTKLEPCFESIYESGEQVKVKEVFLEIHPFDKNLAELQKSTVKPIFERITNKLLDVVLVPRHREQLLFRSLLASRGPFSRIMPS